LTDYGNRGLPGHNTTQFRWHVPTFWKNPATFIFRTEEIVLCMSVSDNTV